MIALCYYDVHDDDDDDDDDDENGTKAHQPRLGPAEADGCKPKMRYCCHGRHWKI